MTAAVAESPGVRRSDREPKEIVPGTPGWTWEDFADDSYDWHAAANERRRFEIHDGILVEMSPVGEQTGGPPDDLHTALVPLVPKGAYVFRAEVDLVLIDPDRTVLPDLAVYSAAAWREQKRHEAERGLDRLPRKYRPIRVMPEVVVESISEGGVRRDRVEKRAWYAEAGIRHYWLLDAKDKSLECLVLDGGVYRQEARGVAPIAVHSAALGGIEVPLAEVWPE